MPSFAVSQKWMGNSEQVFINQLNLRPTSIGKHNSTGHLLPCAIDFKTNHPPIHLQWIGKLGIATEQSHVISMGPHQPEVPGEAIVCSDIKRVKDSVKVWLVLKDMTGIISYPGQEAVASSSAICELDEANFQPDYVEEDTPAQKRRKTQQCPVCLKQVHKLTETCSADTPTIFYSALYCMLAVWHAASP